MNSASLYLPYLPNAFWFRNFLRYETIFIERQEKFVKSTYRNRCEIAGPGGKQLLSIPVRGGRDHHQFYKEVNLSEANHWQSKHWQSIRSAYGSAPYFEFYAEKFESLYSGKIKLLFEFNAEFLYLLLHLLKLRKSFDFTTIYEKHTTDTVDLRSVENSAEQIQMPRYYQVFEDRNGFIPNLSIIDLLFHLGPGTKDYLLGLK